MTAPVNDGGIPRYRPKGEEVWRLRHPEGERVQACEICDDNGWTVLMLENGEPLFVRGCVDEREARDVARIFREDTVRSGWG
jgi:hypothetical protein